MKKKNPIAQALGRKGGLATKKKYGRKHFSNLGKKRMKNEPKNRDTTQDIQPVTGADVRPDRS